MGDKVFFEPQIQKRPDDSFILHLTVSRHDGVWTSPPWKMEAKSWGEAQAEAKAAVAKLAEILKGEQ